MHELGKAKTILLPCLLFVNLTADNINTLSMGGKIGTTSISILVYADDIVLLTYTANVEYALNVEPNC